MESSRHWNKELEGYRQGKLSKEERFVLEKAALDDPFLFDALEGYSTSHKAKQKKSFSIRNIAIAASLVGIVAMTAYFRNTNSSNVVELAQVEKTNESNTRKSIAMHTESEMTEVQPSIASNYAAKAVPQKETQSTITKMQNERAKSQIIHDAPSAKIFQKTTTFARVQPQELALERSNEPVRMTKIPMKSIAQSHLITYRTDVTPAMGWERFEENIKAQKGSIVGKEVSVVVYFTINEKGILTSIRTDKSNCRVCEEKAKALIKNSGVWTNESNQSQSLSYTITY